MSRNDAISPLKNRGHLIVCYTNQIELSEGDARMLSEFKFKVYNFALRGGVEERLNHTLSKLSSLLPEDADGSATIEKVGDEFVFEITLRCRQEVFSSYVKIGTHHLACRNRHWQIHIVNEMYRDIVEQIRDSESDIFGWGGGRRAA